jgi:hydrogenase nickel incorporation protein HypA/HybF
MVHEWALAEAIVNYVLSEASRIGVNSAEKIVLKLGVLQSIDREILDFSLKELFKMNNFSVKEIKYIDEPVRLRCRRCGYEWSINVSELDETIRESIHFVPETVYSFFKCPRCGSRDFEIVSGRGIRIEEIKWGGDK